MLKVMVTVEGGLVQSVEVPPGVEVEVRDYDCEGSVEVCAQDGDHGYVDEECGQHYHAVTYCHVSEHERHLEDAARRVVDAWTA